MPQQFGQADGHLSACPLGMGCGIGLLASATALEKASGRSIADAGADGKATRRASASGQCARGAGIDRRLVPPSVTGPQVVATTASGTIPDRAI